MKVVPVLVLLSALMIPARLSGLHDSSYTELNKRHPNLIYTNVLNLAIKRFDIAYERFLNGQNSVSLTYFRGRSNLLFIEWKHWALIGRYRYYFKTSGWHISLFISYEETKDEEIIGIPFSTDELYHFEYICYGTGAGYMFRPYRKDKRFIYDVFFNIGSFTTLKESLLYDKYPEYKPEEDEGPDIMFRLGVGIGYAF